MGKERIGGGKTNTFSNVGLSLRYVSVLQMQELDVQERGRSWIFESIHKLLIEGLVMDTQSKAWVKTSEASMWAHNRRE